MPTWTEADERAWRETVGELPAPPRRWWTRAGERIDRVPAAAAAAGVALLSALSAVAYLLSAESLRHERAALPYRRWLFGEYRARGAPVLPDASAAARVDAGGAWTVLAFAGACLLAALLAWMARREERDVGPELAVYTFAAAVAPVLLLAAAWWPDGRGHLTSPALITAVVGAVALAAAAAAVSARRRARGGTLAAAPPGSDGAAPGGASSGGGAWGWGTLAAAALVLPALWWNAASDLRGYDSVAYHLPIAAGWLRHSRLVTGDERQLTMFFPGNHELLLRWALALGTDRYAFAVSLAAGALSVYAVYKLGREVGQPRDAALAAAACAATCPLLVYLGTTAYSDVTAVCPLLLALLFVLRWARADCARAGTLACAGAAVGLAAGSKLSALPPAAAIAAAALALGVRAGLRRPGPGEAAVPLGRPAPRRRPRAWRSVLAFAVPAALCGGYWYARNLGEHGNPFFPVSVIGLRGLDMRYFVYARPDLAAPSWRWPLYPWREFGFLSEYEDGLGIAFAALAVPGLLLTPLVRRRERRARYAVWLVAACSYLLWLGTGNATPRYGLFPIVLSYVFAGELWACLGSRALRAVTLACVAAATLVTGYSLAAHAVYTTLTGRSRQDVPAVVDTLPPARIYNAAGAQRSYFAMGRDHRHQVVTPFGDATPDDVLRVRPDYLLLDERRLAAFAPRLALTLVARSGEASAPVALWRLDRPPGGGGVNPASR
ncbi:MAG TPA: glycosyltransferase family 39 protein [Gemmatimonadaceae bacterium]|nr:glycosyltransferase family 39 protein [Gemmatimonadaceae bacterium]